MDDWLRGGLRLGFSVSEIINEHVGGWYFRARLGRNGVEGYWAFAKQSPFVTEFCGMDEPGPIWFELAPTAAEALQRLKAEVLWSS